MQIIYMVLSVLGLVSFVVASLVKGENVKTNLFFVFIGSVFVGASYLLAPSGINGAVSAFIGALQAIINYFFNAKNKAVPIWLTAIFAAVFLGMNIAVLDSWTGVIAILATLCFVGGVSAKSGKGYRTWQMGNNLLWVCYDIFSRSYGPLLSHGVQLGFTAFGAWINDYRKKEC